MNSMHLKVSSKSLLRLVCSIRAALTCLLQFVHDRFMSRLRPFSHHIPVESFFNNCTFNFKKWARTFWWTPQNGRQSQLEVELACFSPAESYQYTSRVLRDHYHEENNVHQTTFE